ncbi:MAG: adenylate/guanylate cyclase domain-containing protein, partial [Myxococcaceae bacterium]
MKTANLAIVFTDIKGFTQRTSAQTLEQNERLLALHASLLSPLFRAFGGHIIKTIGDAFLVTFESPTQAVLSGAAIQDRLWQHNREAPEAERLEVRVAINVGEVRVEKGDVFGEPVNIAARVEGITDAGEVYFTEAVYLSMNKAEVPSAEVGAFELKGIPGKVKVFKVPKAPYRVEAPVAGAPEGAMPPYGNLGLSRVRDDVASRAAGLGAHLVEATSAAFSSAATAARGPFFARYRKPLAGAAGALLLVVALALSLSGSKLEEAIEAVESAPASKKQEKIDAATRLIEELKDPVESGYFAGRRD